MAKKFLEQLQIFDPLEDDFLGAVIPAKREAAPKKKKNKNFLSNLEKALGEDQPATPARKAPRRKSFLASLETAIQDNAFDEVIPLGRPHSNADLDLDHVQKKSPVNLMVPQEALDRARDIALQQGIRVSEVINVALRYYLENGI